MNEQEQSQRLADWLKSKGIEVNHDSIRLLRFDVFGKPEYEVVLLTQNVLVLMDCWVRLSGYLLVTNRVYESHIIEAWTKKQGSLGIGYFESVENWQPAMCEAIIEAMFKMMESE